MASPHLELPLVYVPFEFHGPFPFSFSPMSPAQLLRTLPRIFGERFRHPPSTPTKAVMSNGTLRVRRTYASLDTRACISSLLVRKTPKQCKARWYEWFPPSKRPSGQRCVLSLTQSLFLSPKPARRRKMKNYSTSPSLCLCSGVQLLP
jgi:hypothetical protein